MDLLLRRNQAFSYDDGTDALIDRSITRANIQGTKIGDYAFHGCNNLKNVNAPNLTNIKQYAFYGCSKLKDFTSPIIAGNNGAFIITASSIPTHAFYNCSGITSVFCTSSSIDTYPFYNTNVVTAVFTNNTGRMSYTLNSCSNLESADFQFVSGDLGTYCFRYNSKMTTVILRKKSAIVRLWAGVSVFDNTPFASGKTGGTLYVPESLISAYETDSKWSTILGYTNNSIAPIEGSQYEHYYADGTPIPS